MAISEIYQYIWENGVELPEAPGWTFSTTSDLLSAFPHITPKRLQERCTKSPYMSQPAEPSTNIGWLIHVPPRSLEPSKTRTRVRAPVPDLAPQMQQKRREATLGQTERVAKLGPFSCIPTLDNGNISGGKVIAQDTSRGPLHTRGGAFVTTHTMCVDTILDNAASPWGKVWGSPFPD